jgi:hypothetical protein
MGSALWAHAITGPARGAVLTVLVAIILFGVFAAKPERVAHMAAGCFVALTCVVLWKA